MKPIHKKHQPQTTRPPYSITCGEPFIEPGERIQCTIRAFGDYVITGFMLQYIVNLEAAGLFPDDPDVYKGMQCSGREVNVSNVNHN